MVAEGDSSNHHAISKGRKKRVGSGGGSIKKSSSSSSGRSSPAVYTANNNNHNIDEDGLLVDFRRRSSTGGSENSGGRKNSPTILSSSSSPPPPASLEIAAIENVDNEVMAASLQSDNAITRGREKTKGILARAGQSLRSLSRSRSSRGGHTNSSNHHHSNDSGENYNSNSSSSSIGSRIISSDIFKRSSSFTHGGGGGGSSSIPLGDTDSLSSSNSHHHGYSYSSSSTTSSAATMAALETTTTTEMIITVTSCRSDAYHDQRAPGSTVKLPRRAPSALKTFHELAVGIKDAYEAGGCTPRLSTTSKPPDSIMTGVQDDDDEEEEDGMSEKKNSDMQQQQQQGYDDDEVVEGQRILFDFMGNLDFLLALVEEVAIDTATRGALKEDTTFRGLRDVIKKCNKVLELMLVRRQRKYTLMFRIVGPRDVKMLKKISHWNVRVEKALGGVTQDGDGDSMSLLRNRDMSDDGASDVGSVSSMSSSSSRSSQVISAVVRRGRELLPTAGKVRARRATPTPRLRLRRSRSSDESGAAGEDGYSSDTVPMTAENLAKLQLSPDSSGSVAKPGVLPQSITQIHGDKKKKSAVTLTGAVAGQVKPMTPKEELQDVIRSLRSEQMRAREAVGSSDSNVNVLDEIKSNFTPKAEIPSAVPKLPIEYIHRHRLMKQVVNCLLDRAGPHDTDDESPFANTITCITSRHSDKAGNGKTTLAVAAIQTVEVREFFSDGIAWIHLGRTPLGEREIRRLYEQLYDQLLGSGDADVIEEDPTGRMDDDDDDASSSSSDNSNGNDGRPPNRLESTLSSGGTETKLAKSRRSFQGGELEGIKEDLARLVLSRKILICLDDVCRMEDAKWFLFGTRSDGNNSFEDSPHRVLITTRIPGLVGPSITHEVFVRIFSEHEAVKLMLTAAGRRPNGLPKVSPVFAQARIIVKGCGNSPLALRIAGGMLRSRNRNWTLSSPAWKLLVEQCRTSLEEASKIRSFANSVQRLIDLSFATVISDEFRSILRQCFVGFAMVFHDTDSLKAGKGIPRVVVIRLFAIISSLEGGKLPSRVSSDDLGDYMDNAAIILDTLETMNLLQRAGHGLTKSSALSKLNKPAGGASTGTAADHKCYSMHESVKAIAEEMAKRKTAAFAPLYNDFYSFMSRADVVAEWNGPQFPFDECMVMMLDGEVAEIADSLQSSLYERWNMEEYSTENTPLHLIRAKMVQRAVEVLVDRDFCCRRVIALGPFEATRRHVSDLIDLRRAHAALNSNKKDAASDINIVGTVQEGAACIITEVVQQSQSSPKSLDVAICLSTMGEGLIKARQPRDASQRLEEAADLYRELLGPSHIDFGRAVNALAKSLVKVNETRAALVRFGEASSTFEECKSSNHFDSIANLQGMANLFVTSGDFQAATALYENVISRKASVHGEFSFATAKTINDYAVILAKNGRMDDALARYEKSRFTYERALEGLPSSMSWLNHGESAAKCGFDMALIHLNIASIKSKKGDIAGAINSYETGVLGLRKYKEELELSGDDAGRNKNSSHMRHLVSALGRVGSLKLKQGAKDAALEAYAALFKEVDYDSPTASRLEKAKAHIKCATIYRQSGEREGNKHAILHLREAFNMYTELYGPKHKDTIAVATSLQQWVEESNHGR
jgi:tetratricopeptide (TPR) repeat protein